MLPIFKYIHICLFLSALTAPSAVQPVPLPAPGGHEQTSVQHVPLPVPIDGKTPKQVIDELIEENLLREVGKYKPTPEEKHELSKKLSLSSEDYGASYTNPVVSRMDGSGEYEGRDDFKVNKKDLVIKTFNTDNDRYGWRTSIAAILGEVRALRKVGDLVDFGTNWEDKSVIIMRRKDGLYLTQLGDFLSSKPEVQQKMVEKALLSTCTKAATIAFEHGVWHNDNDLENVLFHKSEEQVGSVVDHMKLVSYPTLIDFGEFYNYFVEPQVVARAKEYQGIFVSPSFISSSVLTLEMPAR
ncbi:hypothetical protein EV361DRAFT_124152 [Lentinula raphanica]|nr:hypothetical protein EV361DRAFT_124152 [Lentinula raphanica]